jgi:hypothetical protein
MNLEHGGIRGGMVRHKPKLDDPGRGRALGQPRRSERRERRSPISVLLKVCGFDSSGRIFSELAGTRNISRSGCCIHLRREPLKNTSLALQVIPHEKPVPQSGPQLLYHVAWVRPTEDGWDVGLFALGRMDLLQVAFAPYTP